MRDRATESAGEIDERLEMAREQLRARGEFDHVIVNDDVDRAADELEEIVARPSMATARLPWAGT